MEVSALRVPVPPTISLTIQAIATMTTTDDGRQVGNDNDNDNDHGGQWQP